MRDIAFVLFLAALLGLGLKRPFLLVLAYAYIDIVSPQHLSYYLLNSISISMLVASAAIGGWLLFDKKKDVGVAPRQFLMLLLLGYCYFTTVYADFPEEAALKWDWVWKALFWAIFLPLTLRTKLRIEAHLLIIVLAAASIIITGGIKTLLSGGGYGALNLMVDSNTGLYEGSQISTVAIALVPIILWLARFGTVFPRDWRVQIFALGLIFACLLIPVGTEARTGLVCIAVLAILLLRDVKRRIIYISLIGLAGIAAIPMLPSSFTNRMETIGGYQADASASTRIAVWVWTLGYVKDHPLGGGFEAYRQNKLQVRTVSSAEAGPVEIVDAQLLEDQGRSYHSSYFEILGEQGFPGIILFLLIHATGLIRMEVLRRRYQRAEGEDAWISPLATALQSAQIIYLVGSLFVGIAFQPVVWMLIAIQIGFDRVVARRAAGMAKDTGWAKKAPPAWPLPVSRADQPG
jgi:probable O-glycosylation ligase (exosortase A-associated)